jgi:hypothetical protein
MSPSFITMIESGRRSITDRGTLVRIAQAMAIPPHVLGIAGPDDPDLCSVLTLGASVVRLATISRHGGHAAMAVGELWPLIASLESRVAAGHAEPEELDLLAQAQVSFGVALGNLLPRLQQALRIEGDPARGNDALVLLARAAAAAGRAALFYDVTGQSLRALDKAAGQDALLSTFTVRDVRLRGLLATDRLAAAVALTTRPTSRHRRLNGASSSALPALTSCPRPATRRLPTTCRLGRSAMLKPSGCRFRFSASSV